MEVTIVHTPIDAERPYYVYDGTTLIGRFATEEEAAAFVESLRDRDQPAPGMTMG